MEHNLVISKSNRIIEAGYKLSLQELRLIGYCISKVNPLADLAKQDTFVIKAREISDQYKLSPTQVYRDLSVVADRLFERYVTIREPKSKRGYTKTRWVSSVTYLEDEGEIELCFAQKMIPHLTNFQGSYTNYRLEHISQMTSIHAVRLYELIIQWKGTKSRKRSVSLTWLKSIFQIEDNYKRYAEFKRSVLLPAVNQINKFSDIKLKYKEKKTVRKVTDIEFSFKYKTLGVEKKKQDEIKKTKKSASSHLVNDTFKGLGQIIDNSILDDTRKQEQKNQQHLPLQ